MRTEYRRFHWIQQVFLIALAWGLAWGAGLYQAEAQKLFTGDGMGPREIDEMYVRGIQFLVRSQSVDGRWPDMPYGGEPGVVGLAVVSILAHGDDPNTGPYQETVRRGLDYILKQQNPESGYIGRSMYNHGFATLALAEAYGTVLDDRLGTALRKAVQLILTSQEQNPHGAWRYTPESKDADTTVSGAQLVALFAARNAGLEVPDLAIEKGLGFFRRCQTREGGFGYTSPVGPNAARSAIGCLVFSLADLEKEGTYQSAVAYLQTSNSESHYFHYYLYYAAQAYFRGSPDAWRRWNAANIQSLRQNQSDDGSWPGQYGSTFCTATSLLSLALNYRFLPIYER